MKHFASPSFWNCYKKLPLSIQELADKNFEIMKNNSEHPSLHLKRVGKYWSVRVGKKYRALATEVDDGIIWFWIGTHAEYNKLIK
ncbi:MAG: hypothetical protein HY934_07015 [Candidatus Firestonebacteria bacterium]|nr:hypothetical protein [Candidatus Firestonebacteria bacterium]